MRALKVNGTMWFTRFMEVAESFLQYAETLQERGTAVDMTLSGNDLQVRATRLQEMPFTETGGELYRAPAVSFTPWYDLHELLVNYDDNVVGRLSAVSQSPGKAFLEVKNFV